MDPQPDSSFVSRRTLLAGTGAALAGGVAVAVPDAAQAGSPPRRAPSPLPSALAAPLAGLTYLPIDGLAFLPAQVDVGGPVGRVYAVGTGTQPLNAPSELFAPLLLPTGSVLHQINLAYVTQATISIEGRNLAAPNPPTVVLGPLAAGGTGPNPRTQTFDLATPITIEPGATYTVKAFFSAGDSLFGLTLGYLPPAQGFVPFVGADPRVVDSRVAGGKLSPGEDRIVDFAPFAGAGARSVLFNLTVTETEGTGGFVGAFSAALATWPGTSTINWFGANQNLANAATCALDSSGRIKLRGGANRTHVVIDVVGYLV